MIKVAVLGASSKAQRYSYMAVMSLQEAGHIVFPVNPALAEIEGLKCYPSLSAIEAKLDTVTLYLGPARQVAIADELLAAAPRRAIFNPGTENPALEERLRAAGIEVLEACTLVLLKTGAFI